MSIHSNGDCEGLEARRQHKYDDSLGVSLTHFFKNENVNSVLGFGCGMGNYVKTFRENNINAVGFDGKPNNLPNVLDVSVPIQFVQQFDWIIALEAGEHLPEQSEDIFIQNLHNNNKYGIVLSWALNGQNNDIKSKICELGYINDIESENNLRNDSTMMVFRKKYYYKQDNYNLCLLYNKPENLNSNITKLPNVFDIGNYIGDYRKYFNSDKNKFMIDIGANIGLSACPVLSLGHKVVCFEPELLNVEILKNVKNNNHFDNMFIENFAVIGEKGKNKTSFYSNINREDNSSVNELCCGKNVKNIGIIKKEVNSITLDEWFEINKDKFNLRDLLLIKIDVQGGELEILKGAEYVLKQCSTYGDCQVEIECDEGFMQILNINFDIIHNLMDSYGYVCKHKGYDSVFVPKKTIIATPTGGLCNVLKNILSVIRIKNKNNYIFLINKHIFLDKLFDSLPLNENNENKSNAIYRHLWRFALFDSDKNLDKIINNNFSLMFPDFCDHLFFPNYKNNSIDFIYRPDLFNDIYEEYSNLFKELKIKEYILQEINDFCKQFNENTISVHLRSWVDCKGRARNFDINKFYNEIDKFDDTHRFFISSDDTNLSYQMKKKYGNKIITYDKDWEHPIIKDFIDLMLLSKNNILIGTYISTFTEMAYIINYNMNKKIIIL